VVTGKVTLAGAPLSAGTVLFMTDGGQAASAAIAADGSYTLQCPPGSYKVAVTPPPAPDPLAGPAALPAGPPPRIPARYQDLGKSGLTVEVKAGTNKHDIALQQ